MVSHSRLHDLFKGIVDPSPNPAVDINTLHSKSDSFLREVFVLQEKKGDMAKLKQLKWYGTFMVMSRDVNNWISNCKDQANSQH